MPEKWYTEEFLYLLDSSYRGTSKRISTPQIRDVAVAYEANIFRAISLAQLPEFIARSARRLTIITEFAKARILSKAPDEVQQGSGEVKADYLNSKLPDEVLIIDAELFPLDKKTTEDERFYAAELLKIIFNPADANLAKTPLGIAVDTIYTSLIINVWTAFETMAGDLWENALNVHPNILADLSGADKRISKLTKFKQRPSSELVGGIHVDGASIKLSQIRTFTKGTYEISNKLGTLLKQRHKFTVLDGIRIAYSEAFSKAPDEIDSVLANDSLDVLNTLRNILVHKAGFVDEEYDAKQKMLTDLPKSSVGSKIVLDHIIVRNRVNAAVQCGVNLLVAVDAWVNGF